ncbi:hypothetical protein LEP1GSC088_0219 [Leptospira interrogans str. L1207]|nr:hypothetical protein LEP1GSC088_0219 [Leptospira interrogans str. L1207]
MILFSFKFYLVKTHLKRIQGNLFIIAFQVVSLDYNEILGAIALLF